MHGKFSNERWRLYRKDMNPDFADIELNDHQRMLLASAADHLGVPWSEVFEQAIAPLVEASPKKSKSNGMTETP